MLAMFHMVNNVILALLKILMMITKDRLPAATFSYSFLTLEHEGKQTGGMGKRLCTIFERHGRKIGDGVFPRP